MNTSKPMKEKEKENEKEKGEEGKWGERWGPGVLLKSLSGSCLPQVFFVT